MKLKTTALLAAVAAGTIAMSMFLPAAAQARCRGDVTKSAIGNFQFSTRITARNRWRAAVRLRYGGQYASWVRAVDKTEQCDKSGPGGKWHCVASARPCN